MAKVFKVLLIGIVALLVGLAAAAIAVAVLVDPNDYRDDISRLVKENTGQELVIEGDVQLRFFPWLGLDLGRTRLENPEGFGDQPMVQIESAGVAVQVLPLLRRELVMDVVRLHGLLVHLVVNEQGEANWEQLNVPESEEEVVTEAPPDEPDRAPPVRIGRLPGVELTNAHVVYEDRQQGSRQELGPVNLYTGELAFDRDVPVAADWVATLDPQTRIRGEFRSQLRINEALDQIRFQLQEMQLTSFAEGLPEQGLSTRISALAEADLSAQTASVRDLRIASAGLRLDGSAEVTGLDSEPQVEGRFAIPQANLRTVLEQLGQDVPETADPDVLQAFSAEGRFSAGAETAQVEDLAIRLDDTRMNGNVSVTDFSNPMLGFRLEADRLNADRYLPPETEDETAPAGEGEDEPVELPMEVLKALRLDGSFQLGELIVSDLTVEDVGFTVQADNGITRVHPISAQLYGGEYSGDIRIDATGEQAHISVNERISNVQARELVSQLLGRDLLEGRGNLTLEAEAVGVELMELLRTLAGEAQFHFEDGSVFGINIAQRVRNATARLRGRSPEDDAPQRTDFTEMAGRVVFDGGKIRNENLNVESPLLRLSGGGEVDMLDQTVDYRLTVNLVDTLTGQDGEPLDELRRLPIPLHFRGDLFDPDINLDLAGALTARQQQELREEQEELRRRAREAEGEVRERIEEEREEIEDQVRERAREELRDLFR